MKSNTSNRSISRALKSGVTAALTAAGLLLVGPSVASAALMTLTFDDGMNDPTIVYTGGETHGPYDWIETNGIRSAGWWATDVGTASGAFQQGHTHPTPNFSGRPDGIYEGMHSWTDDLQGLNISLENGASFDVVSIDYSIRTREETHPDLERLGWATGPEDAQLLMSDTLFDPTASDLESQWTQVGIDDFGLPFRPFFTLNVAGFNNLQNFYLSHTIGLLGIDTIVLDVHGSTPVPEPSAALLIGLGLAGLSRRAGRKA